MSFIIGLIVSAIFGGLALAAFVNSPKNQSNVMYMATNILIIFAALISIILFVWSLEF